MRSFGRLIVGLLLWGASTGAAHAQDAAALKTFENLNNSAAGIYKEAKQRFLKATDPVVIVGFPTVQLRHNGTVTRCCDIPPAYHVLKTVGHVPRSIWAALRRAIDGLDPEDSWRSRLTELRPLAEAALAALPQAGLPPEVTEREAGMLKASMALINRYLEAGAPSHAELQAALRPMAPAILADAAEAARVQLDALDASVRPWWNALSEEERARTYVLVLGPKTPRAGNAGYNYFLNLLGPAEAERRVVYAEGIFTDEGADLLLSTLATDRRLSADFFADGMRMDRDLLADGAEAHLLQMFGRLGSTSAPARRLAASP